MLHLPSYPSALDGWPGIDPNLSSVYIAFTMAMVNTFTMVMVNTFTMAMVNTFTMAMVNAFGLTLTTDCVCQYNECQFNHSIIRQPIFRNS